MVLDTVEAELVCEAAMDVPRIEPAGPGTIGVYSTRSPIKITPNEDAAAILPAGEDTVVLAVADGVGGHAGGERAARIALESLREAIDEQTNGFLPAGPSLRPAILDAFENANREILAMGNGAATTLAVVEIVGPTVRSYHVGDSMILLVGGRGKIKWQTIPHSPVGYGVEAGLLNEIEAMLHENRHVVSNVVGCTEMRIDIGPARELAPLDTLLLASDGLADNLHVEEIVQSIRKGPLEQSMRKLIREAGDRMRSPIDGRPSKPDDLTIVLYRPRRSEW